MRAATMDVAYIGFARDAKLCQDGIHNDRLAELSRMVRLALAARSPLKQQDPSEIESWSRAVSLNIISLYADMMMQKDSE